MITTKLYLMKQLYTATLTLLITVIATALQAQVTLSANGPGDTYALIESRDSALNRRIAGILLLDRISQKYSTIPSTNMFSFSIAIP